MTTRNKWSQDVTEHSNALDLDEGVFAQPGDVSCERATYVFRHPGPPSELLATFRTYYGPTMNAFEAAAKDGRESQLEAELTALFEAQNQGGPESTEIPATYLKVVVTRT